MFWTPEKRPSRKYVDLIWEGTAKYSLWDPLSEKIRLGDYGDFEIDTAKFKPCGNIYEEGIVASLPGDTKESDSSFTSLNARTDKTPAPVDADSRGEDVKFEGQFKFSKGTGAVLAAYDAHETTFPRDFNSDAVARSEKLKDKYLVTSVTSCSAYALYLSAKGEAGFTVRLVSNAPTASESVPPNGLATELSWRREPGDGFYRAETGGKDAFTVVFDLKKCTAWQPMPWLRDSPEPERFGADGLADVSPPWPTLNDDGEEEELYEG